MRTLTLLSVALASAALVLVPGAPTAERSEKPKLDPHLPYQAQRSEPVRYEVEFVAIVTVPAKTKLLRVWLPLPQSDAGQEVGKGEITTFPMEAKPTIGREQVHGNTFAYFEFPKPEGAQIIRHRFPIKVWELRWQLDPDKVEKVERWPAASFDPYLKGDSSVVVDERFREAARKVVPQTHGEASDLARIMDWVNAHMKYDHASASLKTSAEHALDRGTGHCSDYHGLCAAFGRALGYPMRVTYGINPFLKSSPSHCKVEAYLPPYGWVSFDVSETQRLLETIKKVADLNAAQKDSLVRAAAARLRSGFRDNTWFLQTRGTDYELEPRAAKRAPVVRTIYAEADGVALPEPDPADPSKREFSWMTAHKYVPDRVVTYPFSDWKTLAAKK